MAYREFTDESGVAWRVWDTRPHSAANVRSQYAGGWLSFECEGERRRLGPIPDDWAQASDEELWSWVALAVPTRSGSLGGPSAPAPPVEAATMPAVPPEAPEAPPLAKRTREAVVRARAVIRLIDETLGLDEPPTGDDLPKPGPRVP